MENYQLPTIIHNVVSLSPNVQTLVTCQLKLVINYAESNCQNSSKTTAIFLYSPAF